MLLYHGTTGTVARLALTEGLKPRGDTGVKGNWESNPSNTELVYLSVAYAPYFAMCACTDTATDEEDMGIVVVDTDRLSPHLMRPDEDFLEQVTRMGAELPEWLQEELNECATMEERTAYFKNRLAMFGALWEDSVNNLGNAAYEGVIPPEAIVSVSIYKRNSNSYISMSVLDPSISLLNYKIMGDKYRALTRWFFEEVTLEEVSGMLEYMSLSSNPAFAERLEAGRKELADRSGLHTIDNPLYKPGSVRPVAAVG